MLARCFNLGSIPECRKHKRMMIVNNRSRPSLFVYNCWKHLRWDDGRARLTTVVVQCQVEQKAVLIWEHIFKIWNQNVSPGGRQGRSECGSDANFYIAFHSNYASILLSFRDMTTGRTTVTDSPTAASLNAGQRLQ